MRLRQLALPVAVLITGVVSASAADAATATTVQSAWWNEAAVGPLAVPTTTPADQLQVSNGLAGPLAFSAVRITPASGTPSNDELTLKLTIPTGSSVGTPIVSACVTTSPWKAGADQSAKSAPGYSCDDGHSVAGSVSNSTETWTVPVTWASDGAISLALVPAPGTTSPFSVTYDQPTAAAVDFTAPAPATTTPATATPVTIPATSAPAPVADSGSPPAFSVPAGGGGAVGGVATQPVSNPSVSPLPSGGPTPAAAVPSGTPTPVAAPSSSAPGGGTNPAPSPSRVPRLVAFILLIFVGVALFGLAGQPDRAPRLLGPLADRIIVRRRGPQLALAGAPVTGSVGSPVTGSSATGSVGSTARVLAPAHDGPAHEGPAPMGGGARIRAHREARLARTRGEQLVRAGAPADAYGEPSGGTYGGPTVIAPVRGIGRFARARHGPPRRI